MTDYILLFLSVIANGSYNAAIKLLGHRSEASLRGTMRVNAAIYAVICAVIGVTAVFSGERFSVGCLLFGALFGVVTAMSGVFKLLALATGEMSFTVVFISASMVIPSLAGSLFWDEPLSVFKVAGAVIIIVSSCFAAKKNGKRRERGWLIYCFAAFITIGLIGVMQKVQRSSACSESPKLFLLTAFVTALTICLAVGCVPDGGKEKRPAPTKGVIACIITAGGTLAFANLANLYLAGALPSALLFPAQNGGATLLSVVIAAAVFRERPDGRQKIALIASLCGLVILFI